MADKPDTGTGSSSCGGGHQVLPAAVLPTAVILSDIVSEAGAAWVRSWIVELKGRRRGRKEMVSEPGFSVGTSILGCTHHKRLRPCDPTHVIVCSQNICK